MRFAVSRPQPRRDLTVVELDGEGVIYDETSGDLHRLNHTAMLLFRLLDGTATAEELARDLADAYDQPIQVMETQIRSLLDDFDQAGLLAVASSRGGNGGA